MYIEFGILMVGILAGVLSGLFGIGGGIVMVPTLIAFFGMGMLNANATSLAAMLLPVGLLGVINYYKAGYINIKDSLWIAGGLLIGSYFGAELAISVNVSILSKLYAGFLLYIAVSYLNIPEFFSRKDPKVEITNPFNPEMKSVWLFIALGLFAGLIAGIFSSVLFNGILGAT